VTWPPTDRALRGLAYGVVAVVIVLEVATPWAAAGVAQVPGVHPPLFDPWQLMLGAVWCPAALVVITARPRNPIGWLLLGVPEFGALQNFLGAYGTHAEAIPADGLPFGALGISLGSSLWAVALFLPVTLLLLRYPTGRLPSPRWRWVERLVLVTTACVVFGLATARDSVDDWLVGARPVIAVPERVAEVVLVLCGVPLLLTALTIIGNAGWRTYRARGGERSQLLLVLLTGAVSLAAAFLPWDLPFTLTLFLVPIAVAVGVLRYDLLGIDFVVRRTLLYGGLTALVAGGYALVVAVVSLAAPKGPAPGVVAAALVAVGLLPVRARLQSLVDLVVYGERRDPVGAVTRLGSGLPDDDPLPAVVAAVARSLRSPHVALRSATGEVRAAAGAPAGGAEEVLRLTGTAVDDPAETLVVELPRGERRLDAASRRLLEALGVQVAAVIRAVDLGEELQAARDRTVTAALAERERLRHDLHDGLGPSLTGIALGLEAVESSVDTDPQRAEALVARLRTEVGLAVEDVRRILDGLRPPALDELGLTGALRQRAAVLTDRAGGRLVVRVDAPDSLPALEPATEMAAFRIADEALTNTLRHSGASEVVISLAVEEGTLHVDVSDDGCGLPDVPRQGVGLESMQRRAESLGGSLAVTSAAGVRILAVLPGAAS
jgi:signal transduction histidine kinase